MTTLFEEPITCAICGTASSQVQVGSTNMFDSPDLDSRPGEMMRSTLAFWIQSCPVCGYCSEDLTKVAPDSPTVVRTDAYQAKRNDVHYPELANKYLCWALLQENAGDILGAGRAALSAAWACDDAEAKEAAQACRTWSLELFQGPRERDDTRLPDLADPAGGSVLTADLFRRTGQFEEALAEVERGLKNLQDQSGENERSSVHRFLEFERTLITVKDMAAHRMDEVPAPTRDPDQAQDPRSDAEYQEEEWQKWFDLYDDHETWWESLIQTEPQVPDSSE